jgi:uncharacterized protein (DUF427 family)
MLPIIKIQPKEGQESVWDYPRPPIVENFHKHIQVFFGDICIVDSHEAKRVLETSHPPTYYFPIQDVQMQFLELNSEVSFCEFKGKTNYYNFKFKDTIIPDIAWFFPKPTSHYATLLNHIAFYAGKGLTCSIDNQVVKAQSGDFYGGWISSEIVGPFKGENATWDW